MTKNCFDCNGDKDFGCEDCLNKSKGDLISREALKEAIDTLFKNGGFDSGLVMQTIDNAPTVTIDNYSMGYQDGVKQVLTERPQGEWIYHKEWENEGECPYECPRCGRTYDYAMNFCGYCGTDMRNKGEEYGK